MAKEDFDDLLISLKTKRWNYLHFFTISIYFFIIPSAILAGAFIAPNIQHECVSYSSNATSSNSIITEKSNNCSIFYNTTSSLTNQTFKEDCVEWTFDQADFNNTLTSEFGMVCDQAYLRPTFHTLYMVGNIVGGPSQGYLADRFGRRILFVAGVTLMMGASIVSSFMTQMIPIMIMRFLCGVSHPAITCAGYILCMEVCEPKYRSTVGVLIAVPWALGTVWFGFLGYFIRDWRWLQRACVGMAVVFLPMAVWGIDESPRWLIVKGDHKRALRILKVAYKQNKIQQPTDEELMTKIKHIHSSNLTVQKDINKSNEKIENIEEIPGVDKENQERNGDEGKKCNPEKEMGEGGSRKKEEIKTRVFGLLIRLYRGATLLYSYPEMRKRTILVHCIFVVSGTVFYGLSLNAINFGVNPYFYMAIGGIMEIPAYSCPVPIISKFGRIRPTTLCFVLSGVTILALAFIPSDIKWLVVVLAMSGKLCISAAYQVTYVIASEIFPTEVRVEGLGIGSLCSKIGSTLSPFITDAAGSVLAWLPSVIFGCLSLLGAIDCWFIPETVRVHLPDTVEHLEEQAKRQRMLMKDGEMKEEKKGEEENGKHEGGNMDC